MHLKNDRTDASVYRQLFIEIRDRYGDYIPVYTDGSRNGHYVACATFLQSDTVISMRLSDSTSILTANIGQSLKPWNKLKIRLQPNILFLQTHFRVSKLYNI